MSLVHFILNTPISFLEEYVKNFSSEALDILYSTVEDSWTFKHEINIPVIPFSHSMVSLDATSLFTNVKKAVTGSL